MSDDGGDDTTEARRRRALVRPLPERRDLTPLDLHRKESGQKHEAARDRIEQVARDSLEMVASLDKKITAILQTQEAQGAQISALATTQASMHTVLERGRGAMWLGTVLAGGVLLGVTTLIGMVVDGRERNTVQDVEIARLHSEDDQSAQERRELRDAVTRTAGAVERVAGAVEMQDARINRVEDDVGAMRRPNGGR